MTSKAGRRAPSRISVPTRADPLLSRLAEVLGGPMGRHTAPGLVAPGFFTVQRVLLLLTTLAALAAIAVKTPCRTGGWTTPEQFYRACYSDWPELFRSRNLGAGNFPFLSLDAPFEYPVLLGVIAGVTALLVAPGEETGLGSGARTLQYFDINAVLIAGVWILTVLATMRLANRRPWDAAMVAVAPVIIVSGTINWDLWAVLLSILGMLAFARSRPVAAGILLGLGTAVKLYPVLILGAIILLALRSGRFRPAIVTGGALAATWLAVNLPFLLRDYSAWAYFLQFSGMREPGFSSPWYLYNAFAERGGFAPLTPGFVNAASAGLFLLACLGIAVLALAAPRRPRLAQLALLIVGSFILLNKVYSPQYALWLVPLVALAYPRWRTFALWQLAEVMHWWAVWMYLALQTSGGSIYTNIDLPYYALAVAAHIILTAYILLRVVLEVLDPRTDPVRRAGIDDPGGGPFDQSPDRFTLRGRWAGRPVGSDSPRVGLGSPGSPVKESM
ncbi:glycosyltransferase 87 family protein [Arthrobacter sp. Br18]|uniref:glycosyltransferase family 87 protein n=1 Tax=Arthrobacter sp. Br18 TaxID=1312954 RepID=UPI0004B974DA|nr:glycosyltransferase 87 family protein [Arthrobacter sp. Br18]